MTTKKQENIARWGYNTQELDDLDAWSSEWDIVKKAGGGFIDVKRLLKNQISK